MNFRCPVCLFAALSYPPNDYHICPCCGTEFGNDDAESTHEQLLRRWIEGGAYWFYENPPVGWSPWLQLLEGGRPDLISPTTQASFYAALWENVEMLEDNVSNEPNAMQSSPLDEKAMACSMIG
jgi:hypothetical protein